MPIVKQITNPSRVLSGGSVIEFDFGFEDGSTITIQFPFSMIPMFQKATWEAAAAAETAQRQAAGERMMAVVLPYRMQDLRTGRSPDGTIVADFRTAQGPVQVAMTADQTRLTIQRLTEELGRLNTPFPKLS
jgi:hypothetical protein